LNILTKKHATFVKLSLIKDLLIGNKQKNAPIYYSVLIRLSDSNWNESWLTITI